MSIPRQRAAEQGPDPDLLSLPLLDTLQALCDAVTPQPVGGETVGEWLAREQVAAAAMLDAAPVLLAAARQVLRQAPAAPLGLLVAAERVGAIVARPGAVGPAEGQLGAHVRLLEALDDLRNAAAAERLRLQEGRNA